MTMQQIRAWCAAHVSLPHRTLELEGRDDPWGDGGLYHHLMIFPQTGESYEIRDDRNGIRIWINGALAYAAAPARN